MFPLVDLADTSKNPFSIDPETGIVTLITEDIKRADIYTLIIKVSLRLKLIGK